ncbi:hypothetical protein RAB80_008480 [Fusarium oxysporum f. sp. vasinfectum]|nr:hypothetical protein RAB80_008480 [Fusarium oxysporum f. sp. vasinfectum]
MVLQMGGGSEIHTTKSIPGSSSKSSSIISNPYQDLSRPDCYFNDSPASEHCDTIPEPKLTAETANWRACSTISNTLDFTSVSQHFRTSGAYVSFRANRGTSSTDWADGSSFDVSSTSTASKFSSAREWPLQYFATEVRTILDIVLASNPNQKSSELRPPQGSDPLVVLLVKTALEDQRTRDMIRRIAENRPGFTDATDLKEILDRLHRDMKTAPRASPAPVQIRQQTPNGILNGQQKAPHNGPPPNPQALRSKGPPPAPKPDITAVVFDFGSGDRYLFPKFSILEYLPTTTGQQVVASFLIVRKGSTSEYGGDPKLDYYQPVTIRLFTPSGRHLENLARVVAPQDEVRRYMDDVMDHMTRAEYVLLAMRLPKASSDGEKDGTASEEPRTNGSTPKPDSAIEPKPTAKVGVLWTSKGNSETPPVEGRLSKPARYAEQEAEARYQRLINQVSAKDNEA